MAIVLPLTVAIIQSASLHTLRIHTCHVPQRYPHSVNTGVFGSQYWRFTGTPLQRVNLTHFSALLRGLLTAVLGMLRNFLRIHGWVYTILLTQQSSALHNTL